MPQHKNKISKRRIKALLKKSLTRKQQAKKLHVSVSTLYRKMYELKLLKKSSIWITTKQYQNKIIKKYEVQDTKPFPTRYINTKNLLFSDKKKKLNENFTTVGIYFVAKASETIFIGAISIRYSTTPAPFTEINQWIRENSDDIILQHFLHNPTEIIKIIGFHFTIPADKKSEINV